MVLGKKSFDPKRWPQGVPDIVCWWGWNIWNLIVLTYHGETQGRTKMIRFARLKGCGFYWCNDMPILGNTRELSKQINFKMGQSKLVHLTRD